MVFRHEGIEIPQEWSQVACDVMAQKYFRRAGVAVRLKPVKEADVPAVPLAASARRRAPRYSRRSQREAGVPSPRRHVDLLGLEGRLFRRRRRRARLLRRDVPHAGDAEGRAQFAAMVQHRPALGLRHRWTEPGPLLRRFQIGRADEVVVGLRASAAACLLHPGRVGRSRQRRRHHGFVDARSAPVQIRLGHRHEFLEPARRERAAVGRRQVVGPDELPEDRRPRGRRDQVGRHHAARGQDGDRRCRSSRHRAIHQLEGDRGAEGRGHGRGLQARREAPERDPQGLRELRGLGR